MNRGARNITSWKGFARRVRSQGCQLLAHLDEFPNSVLVMACQRSGTTALARVITTSEGMTNYWFGRDDELDAALMLSGQIRYFSTRRHCFQTTYINECYREYLEHTNGHKLIWVIRNPFSVIYSMLHNWGRFAFNELFRACGAMGWNRKFTSFCNHYFFQLTELYTFCEFVRRLYWRSYPFPESQGAKKTVSKHWMSVMIASDIAEGCNGQQ